MKLLLIAAFVGLAVASPWGSKTNDDEKVEKVEYGYKKSYDTKGYDKGHVSEQGYHSKQVYHGKYPGKCSHDGFYYYDEYSFMICSNGNSYQQKCAHGSKNSGHNNYEYGKDYYYHDFCDVNLVDHGYGVWHGEKHGEDHHGDDHHGDNYHGDRYNHGNNHGYGRESHGYRGVYLRGYGDNHGSRGYYHY